MTKSLPFTKMHALSNDFMLIDGIRFPQQWTAAKIKKLAHRRSGVGFDQLLCAEPPCAKEADLFMRIYNSDGSEASQCGNGVRCFYQYVRTQQLTQRSTLKVQTLSRVMTVQSGKAKNSICCDMGAADFSWAGILQPKLAQKQAKAPQPFVLKLATASYESYLVSFGNPHCIIRVNSAPAIAELLARHGAAIAQHPAFVAGINLGVVFLVPQRDALILRTYERGAGPTLACGSNICAAAAVAQTQWKATRDLMVKSPGGSAQVRRGPSGNFHLESPVHHSYNGML